MTISGSFTRSMVTTVPADLNAPEALRFGSLIQRFPEEAIYIYSFELGKMLYADGWEELLGYRDDEISMLDIVTITSPEYAPFSNELNDKALLFMLQKTEELEKYSFTIELKKIHKNGDHIPLIVRVGVLNSKNGRITEIIGRNQLNRSINLGKVMRYAAYGPEKAEFEENLNKELFMHFAISQKERDALAMVARGFAFKEIANHFAVSQSAIEKRILPLYKRFEVKSLSHLVTFAHENHILP
ncbi:LuxR C-terminal-related transcriptional regulator [Daejeonella sp.]|uniref:LuxR C-terminal-related transcriptional regulator n=1 Tax=Daejeonella sp. TaxID=2805397 RepID=UPI0030C609D6